MDLGTTSFPWFQNPTSNASQWKPSGEIMSDEELYGRIISKQSA
jgi:hypothetical protein